MTSRLAFALLVTSLCASAQLVRVGISSSRTLTFDDAVALALRNNLDVEIERANISDAEQAELGARGFRDPAFRWNPQFQILNTASPSVLSGENGKLSEHDFTQSFGLHQRLFESSIFDVSFDTGRTSTNNPFIGLNPYYASQLKFAITQPLLRGRTIDPERAILRFAESRPASRKPNWNCGRSIS